MPYLPKWHDDRTIAGWVIKRGPHTRDIAVCLTCTSRVDRLARRYPVYLRDLHGDAIIATLACAICKRQLSEAYQRDIDATAIPPAYTTADWLTARNIMLRDSANDSDVDYRGLPSSEVFTQLERDNLLFIKAAVRMGRIGRGDMAPDEGASDSDDREAQGNGDN